MSYFVFLFFFCQFMVFAVCGFCGFLVLLAFLDSWLFSPLHGFGFVVPWSIGGLMVSGFCGFILGDSNSKMLQT